MSADHAKTLDDLERWLLAKHKKDFGRDYYPRLPVERKQGYRYVTNCVAEVLDKLEDLEDLNIRGAGK